MYIGANIVDMGWLCGVWGILWIPSFGESQLRGKRTESIGRSLHLQAFWASAYLIGEILAGSLSAILLLYILASKSLLNLQLPSRASIDPSNLLIVSSRDHILLHIAYQHGPLPSGRYRIKHVPSRQIRAGKAPFYASFVNTYILHLSPIRICITCTPYLLQSAPFFCQVRAFLLHVAPCPPFFAPSQDALCSVVKEGERLV